ncbi:S24 family peptidase [Pseudomonas sp. TWR3-1-1]|uniref:S24 family peptidase n=1 Tax=Pseudomonas sp. TWR3-1-1 TaxID=2804633 RepID=UPI003CE92B69
MLTGKDLGAAIESARLAKGVSKKKLAEDFGVAPPSVQGWVKTGRIDKSKLMELMDYFSDVAKPSHWGLSDRVSEFLSVSSPTDMDVVRDEKESNVIAINSRRKNSDTSFVTIPHLDVTASMGPGCAPPEHTIEVIRDITVHVDWLKCQGLNYSKIDNLAIIDGDGDSMEGTFRNGDALLVDRGITEIRTDAIYVFTLDGDLFIKRLQRMTGGALRMISDNPVYPAIVIEGEQLDRVHIQARVLLVWNARKL